LFFLVAASGIEVGGRYYEAHLINASLNSTTTRPPQHTIAGLNLTVPQSQLQAKIQAITAQPATLNVGSQTLTISPSDIKSWLTVSANNNEGTIHVKPATIDNSLLQLAQQFVKAPVNEVTVTHTDGITPSGVIVGGSNGTKLSDPSSLEQQSSSLAKNLLSGNSNLSFNTPTQSVPFQAVTPTAFPKLLEVDVTTKRMYAYQNGQLVNTFLVSAGKPSTPTPLGEFHIWDKLTSQTMTGPGYVQPNVPWVSYFDHSGDAVHGVYWRSASVFGSINTSHGCVGVPVSEGQWLYNWAPIGTTVITYS
jgi:lipoprotein-anchoring transpeptidase ErfK/SrfK